MALPQCRLFLMTPASADPARALACLRAAIEAGDVASLLIAAGPAQEAVARALTAPAQARGVAVLIEGETELAKKVKADGVMIAGIVQDYMAAREALGRDVIVGAACATRDQAMDSAEAGADFVFFADPRLVSWWSEVSVVPCVASGGGEGAEFRVPAASMWDSPAQARAAVTVLSRVAEEGEAKLNDPSRSDGGGEGL
jgi:thiamine-phosphate pyrophosphorylase